jgi:2-keto-4-pentenoate hydratase/2-oxohepta-3-ene-1,7-dioic acid hydratase in catechol pathway
MKFVRYESNGKLSYGTLSGDTIHVIEGDPISGYSQTGKTVALANVKLLAPATPTKILAVGLNYRSHLGDRPAPKNPEIFIKTPSCLTHPFGEIVIPKEAVNVHAEGELVVVMKRRTKRATPEQAAANILGVTCGNDVSARMWQSNDLQWWRAKSSDTFGPVGPVIATDLDYSDLRLQTRINGKIVQSQTTADLIFPVPVIVSFISQVMTLEPGDMVFTGTPGTTTALNKGDVVEVEIEGVGVLQNTVAVEA